MKSIFLSTHDDDFALFGAFTCLREKPLVVIVTDSFIQPTRGEVGCDAETRAKESLESCKILGCPIIRLGIRDDIINGWAVQNRLEKFQNFDKVYVPALQHGNPHHDLVSKVATEVFKDKVVYYTTYAPGKLYTEGKVEIKPTADELILKEKALACFVSQINLPATKPHFEAVKGRSEWLL